VDETASTARSDLLRRLGVCGQQNSGAKNAPRERTASPEVPAPSARLRASSTRYGAGLEGCERQCTGLHPSRPAPLAPQDEETKNAPRELTEMIFAQTVAQTKTCAGAIRGALCRREGVAAAALLRRVRAVARMRAEIVPAERRLRWRCQLLSQARDRARPAHCAMAGAANDSQGNPGQSRRPGTRGAAMHAARVLCVIDSPLPARGERHRRPSAAVLKNADARHRLWKHQRCEPGEGVSPASSPLSSAFRAPSPDLLRTNALANRPLPASGARCKEAPRVYQLCFIALAAHMTK
jgi:hypothetical protein